MLKKLIGRVVKEFWIMNKGKSGCVGGGVNRFFILNFIYIILIKIDIFWFK